MATLSLPTNTPTLDGAVVGCTSDDITGRVYFAARIDRQWRFEVLPAEGITQAHVDADKAAIVNGTVGGVLVWASDVASSATPEAIATQLPEDSGPYYVGRVWREAQGPSYGSNLVTTPINTANGWTTANSPVLQIGVPNAEITTVEYPTSNDETRYTGPVMEAGKTYRLEYQARKTAGSYTNIYTRLYDNSFVQVVSGNKVITSAWAEYAWEFTVANTGASNGGLRIYSQGGNLTAEIKNIMLREVL